MPSDAATAGPGRRLATTAGLTLLAIALFLVIDVPGGWDYVLPRRATTVATMALVGYAVAVSTVLFQTITHNRILTPALMGFDALYILIQTALVAFLGAQGAAAIDPRARFAAEVGLMVLLSGLLYRWLFLGARRSLHLLVLAGIVFGLFFHSVAAFVQRVLDPTEFMALQDRFFAEFQAVDERLLGAAALLVAAVTAVVVRLRGTLDVLALGRDHAVSLGVDYRRTVAVILVLVSVLVAVSTALVGPVTFFGLLVANLAYLLTGSRRHRWTLPMAAVLGVLTLVAGQTILQHGFGLATAISVIIEFLGGITLIVLLLRGART